jgi:hypothetical protein
VIAQLRVLGGNDLTTLPFNDQVKVRISTDPHLDGIELSGSVRAKIPQTKVRHEGGT